MPQVQLRVCLLEVSQNPVALIYAACRQCYSPQFAGDLFEEKEARPEKQAEFIRKVVASGHESPLEHVKFTFAVDGVSRALTHQLVRHRLASYCLTGDTIIKGARQKSRRYKKFTLKSLYERTLTPHGRSHLKLIRLNSFDEDKKVFDRGEIKNIIYTGRQEVWRVKLRYGQNIKATLNHRFFTEKGWFSLQEIMQSRPDLGVNGVVCRQPAFLFLRDRNWMHDRYRLRNQMQTEIAREIGCSSHTVRAWIRKHGLQKGIGGLHGHAPYRGYHWTLGRRRTLEEIMTVSDRKVNNREKEYEKIFGTDPLPYHARSEGCYRMIKWMQIESIEYCGWEDTYDIEMEDPHHNFTANGFVVHNSQQSQRYVKESNFDYIVPPSIESDPQLKSEFLRTMELIQVSYNKLLERFKEKGRVGEMANQDVRFVLPQAAETKIVVTMNARELIHFFHQRCCARAQWEIKRLAHQMLEICREKLPEVFQSVAAKCDALGYCPEGESFSCGKYPVKEKIISGRVSDIR